MKKLMIKTIVAAVFTCISVTSLAQQAERKPAIDESEKSAGQDKTVPTPQVPQIVPAPKAMKLPEQPKPIVPGGEFKPVDTNVPVKNYTRTAPEEKAAAVRNPSQKQQ